VSVGYRSYGRFKYFDAALIPHRDVVPWLREIRTLRANPMSDELGMILCLLPGPAVMSQDVVSAKRPSQIKEKPLHGPHNATAHPTFLMFQAISMGGLEK
jgi:hypothetical protein